MGVCFVELGSLRGVGKIGCGFRRGLETPLVEG